MEHSDVVVVGAGIIGASIACGLLRQGKKVILLDGGGSAQRASLGNFGLVWVQGKGQGARHYTEWCHQASAEYPDFSEHLLEETGIDINYRKLGGLVLCHGQEEYEKRVAVLERLRRESRNEVYDCEMLDRRTVQGLIPNLELGPNILGAYFLASRWLPQSIITTQSRSCEFSSTRWKILFKFTCRKDFVPTGTVHHCDPK